MAIVVSLGRLRETSERQQCFAPCVLECQAGVHALVDVLLHVRVELSGKVASTPE